MGHTFLTSEQIKEIIDKLERYRAEGFEITFYENGHLQSDGHGVSYVEDTEGGLVFIEDVINLLREL